jgi:hypothetical protein
MCFRIIKGTLKRGKTMRLKSILLAIQVLLMNMTLIASYAEDKAISHSMSEASVQNALRLYTYGIKAAGVQHDIGPAYSLTTDGETVFYYFVYYSTPEFPGMTMTGKLTVVNTTSTINGTLSFTGCDVTTIDFNNIVPKSSPSGQLVIHFTDKTHLIYDFSTNVVSQ